MTEKHLLSPTEAATYLGGIIKEQTLASWRCLHRQDLAYLKIGRRIAYRKSDLDAFLESHTVRTASI